MRAAAWNNGAHHVSGAGYGLKITPQNRDRHFQPSWDRVVIDVPGQGATTVALSSSFWRNCSELRSAAVGRWLREVGLAPWPRGAPPVLELVAVSGKHFSVSSVPSPNP